MTAVRFLSLAAGDVRVGRPVWWGKLLHDPCHSAIARKRRYSQRPPLSDRPELKAHELETFAGIEVISVYRLVISYQLKPRLTSL